MENADEVDVVVEKLKQLVSDINTKGSQDTVATSDIYSALQILLGYASSIHVPISQIVATSTLTTLNDLLTSKHVLITYALQSAVVMIFKAIFQRQTPGYIVRNIIQSLINVCNMKLKTIGSRECALQLLGLVFEIRYHDCNSFTQEIFGIIVKFTKSNEFWLRQLASMAFIPMIKGGGYAFVEYYPEIAKIGGKFITDKSPEVRFAVCQVIKEITLHSHLTQHKFIEIFIPTLTKGLEDDVPTIQDEYANVLSLVFYSLILEYVKQQVQIKIDQARGIDPDFNNKTKKISLQDRLTKPKKIIENYDYRSVLRFMLTSIVHSSTTYRNGYCSMLNYFVKRSASELDTSDFEYTIHSILNILQDANILLLSPEETVFFRARICFILHTIAGNLSESQLLQYASILCYYLASMDLVHENCIHVALYECSNIITILSENALTLANNIQVAATTHLHSPSFAVRAQAAYLLSALSLAVSLIAIEIIKQSLNNAKLSIHQITSTEFIQNIEGISSSLTNNSASSANSGLSLKNPLAVKLLQKMFFFHGHVLTISILIKNEYSLPIGISQPFLLEIFDFGLELLQYDVRMYPHEIKQLICNFIRAGSLLLTSCCSCSTDVVTARCQKITHVCQSIISKVYQENINQVNLSTLNMSEESASENEELLFEMMRIESCVLVLCSLLWYCPETVFESSLQLQGANSPILESCAISLDIAYRTINEIFAPLYKSHYRYRTLHVIIIECYAMLPSMASTKLFQGIFQTFRNFTLAGVESDQFSKLAESKRVYEILTTEGLSKPSHTKTIWKTLNTNILLNKLEYNAYPLHPKESESTVATLKNKFIYSYEKEINIKEYSPCARIEARSLDAAIALLGMIFNQESKSNQDKLVTFCCESITQVLGYLATGSTNLFASEEEKKRKLKLNLTTLKNVIFVFYSIIYSYHFPSGLSAYDPSLQFIHQIANSMITLLNFSDFDIKITASYTLSLLIVKVGDFDITESIARKVLGFISYVNELKTEGTKIDWNSYSGHFVVLSSVWTSVEKRFLTKEDITKAVFGALKRIDSSYSFRAHALFALTIIASSKHKAEHLDRESKLSFFETTYRIAEKHVLNMCNLDDPAHFHELDVILSCSLRLINVCISVMAALLPHSSMIKRAIQLFKIIQTLSSHINITYEMIEFMILVLCSSSGHLESSEVTLFLHDIFRQQLIYAFNARLMFGIVKVADALILSDPEAAHQGNIHILLFQLIHKAIGALSNTTQSNYFGIEFKSDPSNEEYLLRNVIDMAEASLKRLVVGHCRLDVDTRVMHWVLLCRAICVPTRSEAGTSANSTSGPVSSTAVVEDETATVMQEKEVSTPIASISSHRQYMTWCNTQAILLAKEIPDARIQLKCIALSCATEALRELSLRKESSYHNNAHLAQTVTDKLLLQLEGNITKETLQTLPCYAALFIEDMVGFCCTCATYTVEDIQIPKLQLHALNCLAGVLHFFRHTPDVVDLTDSSQLLLQQYLSQIMSAVRPCLTAKYNSKLLFSSTSLLCNLIHFKCVEDLLLIKRLLKSMFPFLFASNGNFEDEENSALGVTKSTPVDVEVAVEFQVADEIIALGIAARLFTISQLQGYLAPKIEVKQALQKIFTSKISFLGDNWWQVMECACLVVHGSSGGILEIEDYLPTTDSTLTNNSNVYSKNLYQAIYSKLVATNLVAILPYVIVAGITCSQQKNPTRIQFLFACLTCTVSESGIHKLISNADINNLKFSSLLGLIYICNNPKIENVLLPSQWIRSIRKLLNTLKFNSFSRMELLNYIQLLLLLADKLSCYLSVSTSTVTDFPSSDSFLHWIWIFYLNIFSSLFPLVLQYTPEENSKEDISTHIYMNVFPSLQRFEIFDNHIYSQEEISYRCQILLQFIKGIVQFCDVASCFKEYAKSIVLVPVYWIGCFQNDSVPEVVLEITTLLTSFVQKSNQSEETSSSFVASFEIFLLDDYLEWFQFFRVNKDHSLLACTLSLSTFLLEVWCALKNNTEDSDTHVLPSQFVTMFASVPYEYEYLLKIVDSLFALSLRPATLAKNILLETLLSSFINILSQGGYSDAIEKQSVKLLLANYETISVENMPSYLYLLIGCILLFLRRKTDNVPMTTLCGLGITRVAKSSPDVFKSVLVLFSEEDKVFLQSVMKAAMLVQQAAVSGDEGSGSSGLLVKKFDISKYKSQQEK